MKRLFAKLALGVAALVVAAGGALAQEFPDRPIGVSVSYGAGGATDFQARIVTMVAGNEDLAITRIANSRLVQRLARQNETSTLSYMWCCRRRSHQSQGS